MAKLLVLNIHGMINTDSAVREALVQLKVSRKFTATVVPDDPNTLGLLRLCKNHLAWSPVDGKLLAELFEKRGMASESKSLGKEEVKSLGFKDYKDLADSLIKGGEGMSGMKGFRPFFRLSPPKGGFRVSMRRQHRDGGLLGSNPTLPEIIERMV